MSKIWLGLLLPVCISFFYLTNLGATYINFLLNRHRSSAFNSSGSPWGNSTRPPSTPFSLRPGETDMCLKKPWKEQSVECLQVLLEAAYGPDITFTCPNLADTLIVLNCTGCPWDHLNQTSIEKFGLHAKNKPIFHKPTANCTLADFANTFRQYDLIYYVADMYGIPGFILLFMCSTLLGFDGSEARTIAGATIPEYVFMPTVWILFYVGNILVASVESYFYICESEAGSLTLFTRMVAYFAMLWASIRSYLHLRSRFSASEVASWHEFLTNCQRLSLFKRGLVYSFYYGCFTVVLFTFFIERISFLPSSGNHLCGTGSTDVAYGLYQYSKLLLEVIAITVYSFGASDKRFCRFWLRSAMLLSLFCAAASMMFLLPNNILASPHATILISRALDVNVSGNTELVHVMVTATLGLLEPLRIVQFYE